MPKQTFHFGTRRDFIKSSSLLTGGVILGAPYFARTQNANSKINVACIGVGGKGGSDTSHAYAVGGNIVALCDVDSNRLGAKDKELKDKSGKDSRIYTPKHYKDWRKMLEQEKNLEAVIVATPDHNHAIVSIHAMKMGKHVY